ncbi:MBL fold metallo-hydrolase [Duganella sp. CF458]|uniref:MBL fold metallo-hydrolase n=1 Tax=Duganella sp. CF458 TaxID=1884368 RepID=UPI00147B34C5|nr:MBL fold metallo-hydrolase [Duganella sp. CF458]
MPRRTMPAVPTKPRAFRRAIAATVFLLLALLLAASLLAKMPFASDQVFGKLRSGQLWSEKARYVDDWYAVEAIDDGSYIIAEPKSSQYNSSYLLVGGDRALLIDAGSGERPPNIRSIRALAESLTAKPLMLALSHFHFDHIGDLDAFEGALVLATAELQSRAQGGRLQIAATESLTGPRSLRIQRWLGDGEKIDLGGRAIEIRSTPGHAQESATYIDRERQLVFAGDFLYQHLGGLVVFLPGSDTRVYADEIGELLATTSKAYRYFGAHGKPEFDHDWAGRVQSAMGELASGVAKPVLAESYLAPGLPLHMHRQDQLLIYQPPFIAAQMLYSWRSLAMLGAALALISGMFWCLFRALGRRGSAV